MFFCMCTHLVSWLRPLPAEINCRSRCRYMLTSKVTLVSIGVELACVNYVAAVCNYDTVYTCLSRTTNQILKQKGNLFTFWLSSRQWVIFLLGIHYFVIHFVSNQNTVRWRYNAVIFLIHNPHNRQPITRPWARGMGCLSWVWRLIYVPRVTS